MKKNVFAFLLILPLFILAQTNQTVNLNWSGFHYESVNSVLYKFPKFDGKKFYVKPSERKLFFADVIKTTNKVSVKSLQISNIQYSSISEEELGDLNKSKISSEVNAKIESVTARDEVYTYFSFEPIIYENGQYKKVVSLNYTYSFENGDTNRNVFDVNTIQNSVLATNNWYRFYVEKSGVYKISKAFLQSLGFDTNVNPRNIKIYGNGGRMLPLLNSTDYPIDLQEKAIQFIGEEDGVFNETDYILFYAEGVDTWNTESLTSVNLFADKTYYYVTSSGIQGKRITEAIQPTGASTLTFNKYNAQVVYEHDLVNVAKLGRRWFGEQFNVENNQNFSINVPNLDTSSPVDIQINFAAKSTVDSSFDVTLNGQNLGNVPINAYTSDILAFESTLNQSFTTSSPTLNFGITYNSGGVPSANGYLDFIKVNAVCNLQGNGNQFLFYNSNQATNIGIGEYVISNSSSIVNVWDITDLYNAKKYTNTTGTSFSFKVNLGIDGKYVAVTNDNYLSPSKEANSQVANQNLKGTIFLNNQGIFQDIDCLIISPDEFYNQAENLANFHRNNSGLSVKVVKLNEIYQEFSSGKQDIAAIRNFIKYVYQNASTSAKRVKYVNLFGDASYDYKNRIYNNTNLVPTFHVFNVNGFVVNNSSNMSLTASSMSDDFFGLMDDSEGTMPVNGVDGIDIAVGRMVISSVQQANEMVNKVIQYYDKKSYGRWRNTYIAYSDDADNTTDASLQVTLNNLVDELVSQKPFVNVKKIHTDAYVQEVASGGERYPQAKEDFLNAIELGALVVNYYGHGNEEFLARERLFEKLDAQQLSNEYRFPLFITITCEFTRFDDPNRLTGGEYMYWNTNGGAISLVATTRAIYVSVGEQMNNLLAQHLYAYGSYNYPTIAEAVRLTKLETFSDNRRVVSYIGDPALQLAIPKPQVVLTKVNDVAVGSALPVFQALMPMKIEGEVHDENNNLLSTYNGDVAIQIFDKEINRTTLGNNGTVVGSQVFTMNFNTLGETIVRGNATVVNGKFEFSFIVPQDIRIPVGNGKVSFYSKTTAGTLKDETGYDFGIEIGGVNTNALADSTSPTMQLYMNDESFVSGDITNCSPILLIKLQDEHGINTASGIGHDIVAILDGDETNPYILNDYYETELDDFTQGIVKFPFRNLEAGMHTLLVKAWDVYNNPISMEIQFNAVCSSDGLQIQRVLNYPNPFVSYTEFWFTHNMPFEPLDVQVQIFTITGKVVKTINQQVVTDGFLSREITWDGRDDFGDKIGKGVYVYKLTVKSSTTGNKVEKYEKLVIL